MEFSVLIESELLFGNGILEALHIWDDGLGWLFASIGIIAHHLGSNIFFMALLSIIFIVFSPRLGITLGFGLLTAGIFNSLMKFVCKSPRPFGLEESIANLQNSAGELAFGFPSGHVHSSVLIWGLLFYYVPNKTLRIICIIILAIMPFARMYLGVHFLGDVIGGLILGAINLVLIIWLREKYNDFPDPFYFLTPGRATRTFSLAVIAISLSPVLLMEGKLAEPEIYSLKILVMSSAALAGFLIGLMLLKLTLLESKTLWESFTESNEPAVRVLVVRMLTLASVIVVVYFVPSSLIKSLHLADDILVRYVRYLVVGFSIVYLIPYILFSIQNGKFIKSQVNE
ncbi:MAG: phosphatase PAP2 family protein [Leptospira sp.]|nr:phosphatase PAP2 family protein [Leptospira sp.]